MRSLSLSCRSRWPHEFPPLQDAVVDAASAAGARLLVLENLYMYGPTGGAPMTESTPVNPTSKKSAVRVRLSNARFGAGSRLTPAVTPVVGGLRL